MKAKNWKKRVVASIRKSQVISYELEIVFLNAIIDRLATIRAAHDASREEFSKAVNELFNIGWTKPKSESVRRGATIGVLKHGEAVLNETFAYITQLQSLINARINELNNHWQWDRLKKRRTADQPQPSWRVNRLLNKPSLP